MLGLALSTGISLVLGVITGYFFERRSTNAAHELNSQLEHRLSVLRESIYSVGRGDDHGGLEQATVADLDDRVRTWILDFQGPDGKLGRQRVVQRFLSEGASIEQIRAALVRLDEQRLIVLGEEIEVR